MQFILRSFSTLNVDMTLLGISFLIYSDGPVKNKVSVNSMADSLGKRPILRSADVMVGM